MTYPAFGNVENTDFVYTASGSAVASQSCGVPSAASGDKLVAVFTGDCSNTAATFNTPSGWTSRHSGPSNNGLVGIFEKTSDGTETAVLAAFSTGTGGIIGFVLKITGADSTAVVVPASQDQSGGGSWLSPTITTPVNECLLFTGGVSTGVPTWAAGDEPNSTTLVKQAAGFSMWGGLAFMQFATAGSTAGTNNNQWTNTQQSKRSFAFAIAPSAADTTAPSFTDGPDVDAVADTTATIGATADESGFAAFIADTAGSSQPSDGSFDAVAAAITEDTPFTKDLTGLTAATLYKIWNQLKDATPNRRTSSSMLLTSHAGASSRVTLGTLNPDPDLRITAIPDLEAGQFLEVTTIDGTGTVTLYDDASYFAEPGVTRFFVYGGNLVDGWGTGGWQTIVENNAPTDISLSNSSVSVDAGLNAVVGALSATDADIGATFTFTLVAGTGDTNNADFNISGTSLRCDDPETLGAGTYSVRIQADDGIDTYAEAFAITVSSGIDNAFIRSAVRDAVRDMLGTMIKSIS